MFEFADEWWKNYDIWIKKDGWWDREYAPDDEKSHDLDPEEYYGIFTAERAPRPASIAVREMFGTGGTGSSRTWLYAIPLVLIAVYTVYVFRRKPHLTPDRSAPEASGLQPRWTRIYRPPRRLPQRSTRSEHDVPFDSAPRRGPPGDRGRCRDRSREHGRGRAAVGSLPSDLGSEHVRCGAESEHDYDAARGRDDDAFRRRPPEPPPNGLRGESRPVAD